MNKTQNFLKNILSIILPWTIFTKIYSFFCKITQKAPSQWGGDVNIKLSLAPSPKVDDTLIVEGFEQEEGDGQGEYSDNAEKLNAEIHTHKSDYRVHTHVHRNQFRLKNLAENRY